MQQRAPHPALRPFVRLLWAGASSGAAPGREHVLPTGCMHLVVRVHGPGLHLYDGADDLVGRAWGPAVVGGARCGHYLKQSGHPGWSIGAQLEPGAAGPLFGEAADALAQRHTRLDDLWGHEAALLVEQLAAAPSPGQALALFEACLLRRLPQVRGLHPGVAASLARLQAGASVADAVQASGFSHRHLIDRFRAATGLAPKQHARLLRLQRTLVALRDPAADAAEVALDAGYSDQAHFSRDFRRFAGMTPREWRRAAPEHPHHVPAPPVGR